MHTVSQSLKTLCGQNNMLHCEQLKQEACFPISFFHFVILSLVYSIFICGSSLLTLLLFLLLLVLLFIFMVIF